jgi:hypothetical protein|tara:strand:+ start:1886 stop:2350 length:465 start_codon:yes stop_codon:yes gene_type:complete
MDLKQIRIRKSQNTMTGLVITLLIVIAFFTGTYQFLIQNVDDVGGNPDPIYNSTYGNISQAQNEISDNVNAITDNFKNITEADSAFSVAWNGLKGLGNTLKLPFNFLNSANTTLNAIFIPLGILPPWVFNIIKIGLAAFMIFLGLKILKGEPNM